MKLRNEITTCDVVAIVSSALLIPFFELARTGSYWVHVNDWLDNRSYVQIANVIRVGGIPVGSHFWGLPGGVVIVTFLILCPEWVRVSVIGGSEPLFLCLLLGSWLAFRSGRALMASVFASLATTVRPVGVFALCAFAFTLILQRDWRRLAMSICIAAGVGLSISSCCKWSLGTHSLISDSILLVWPSGNPFSFPFVTL